MLLAALACTSDAVEDSAPAVGLTPLSAQHVEAPTDADDASPERSATASGSESDFDWAVLRGWVKGDSTAVWAALTNPDVGVDRREVASWTVESLDAGDLDARYVVTNVVTEPITVDFDLTWQHQQATDPANGSVSVWEKTAGTEFIPLIAGSIVATQRDDAVDFLAVYHLGTIDSTPEDAERFLLDLYASVLAAAHGESLPTYE